jgi:ribosomal protein L11 methyltransferase
VAWFQIRFTSHSLESEKHSDLLIELGALSVTFEDAEDQPILEPPPGETPLWDRVEVVGLFAKELNRELIKLALSQRLPAESFSTISISDLKEQNWVRAWMDDFNPMQFGDNLWIIPSWSEPIDPNATNILLDPGLAFGTGTHQTTALCMEWLDANRPVDKSVIDYGCGSGILAIAAAKLGARRVICVDNDPQALTATTDNSEKNGVTSTLETYLPVDFSKEYAGQIKVDLLLANILAGPLIELAPTLSSYIKLNGEIVLSGILNEQIDEVVAAYRPWFKLNPPTIQDGWVRIDGVKE